MDLMDSNKEFLQNHENFTVLASFLFVLHKLKIDRDTYRQMKYEDIFRLACRFELEGKKRV